MTDEERHELPDDDPSEDDELPDDELPDDDAPLIDDVDVRDLLRQALAPDKPVDEERIVGGVQKRIREGSEGRYFADGWSTSRDPQGTYLTTSLVMLALLALTYFLIAPRL